VVKIVVCSAELDEKNRPNFGDNFQILREHVAGASVDLIYLDPSFNFNAYYNVLFKEKSGHIGVDHIWDLKCVLDRENASIGVPITLPEPSKLMLTGAATGFCDLKDFPNCYSRPQVLTVAELLAGKNLEYPAHRAETFAKAERKSKSTQPGLF
jgi:hypothetical protein